MKNLTGNFKKACVAMLIFAGFISLPASAQRSIVMSKTIEAKALSQKENERAAHVLKNGFVLKHWFSELTLDPNAEELEVTLPETQPIKFVQEKRREQSSGLISWRGRTADGLGSTTLVWHNGMITGLITVNPKLVYRIQPISKNRHIIYRVNQMNAPKEESKEDYEKMKSREWVPSEEMHSPKQEDGESSSTLRGSDCYIRILVGFDNVAGPGLADPIGFALECIELSNTIYANSQVNFEVELAFATIYNDAASTDIDDALAEWQYEFGDGKFENVHSDREQYDADFCILITEDFVGDYVGLAATILASYSSAFCVVEDGAAIDNLSFPHEIGHLMGARHDLYMDGSGDYNHGYILHSEEVRTVMAYNNECDDNGYNCTRIQYFSNPDVDFPGTSKALGTSAEEHNERALDENESEFKDFEPVITDKVFLFPEFIDGTVYASVTAQSTIQHVSTYEVTDGATVVWSAADWLLLEDGFFAESGSSFEAKTAGCDANKLSTEDQFENGQEERFSLMVYPNPASDEATLSFKLERKSSVSFHLLDLAGRSMHETTARLYEPGMQVIPIDLRAIPGGTYLCVVSIEGEQVVKKLIVQQ